MKVTGRRRARALAAVSTAQLACGLLGHAIALRRGLSYELPVIGMRGRPERVGRDSWIVGTALSAPVVMLGSQAAATARLAKAPSPKSARTLGVLGAAMVGGYLAEDIVRGWVTTRTWDRVETPVVVAGAALAAAMAALGLSRGAGGLLGGC